MVIKLEKYVLIKVLSDIRQHSILNVVDCSIKWPKIYLILEQMAILISVTIFQFVIIIRSKKVISLPIFKNKP